MSTSPPPDYYELLGVSRTASATTIKRAYHEAIQRYHPDINAAPNAETITRMINEAYAVLSDPLLRREYDARSQLTYRYSEGARSAPPPPRPPPPSPPRHDQAPPAGAAGSPQSVPRGSGPHWGYFLAAFVVIALVKLISNGGGASAPVDSVETSAPFIRTAKVQQFPTPATNGYFTVPPTTSAGTAAPSADSTSVLTLRPNFATTMAVQGVVGPDEARILAIPVGGNHYYRVCIYLFSEGHPRAVQDLGFNGHISGLSIRAERLVVRSSHWFGTFEGECCPNASDTTVYARQNGRLAIEGQSIAPLTKTPVPAAETPWPTVESDPAECEPAPAVAVKGSQEHV